MSSWTQPQRAVFVVFVMVIASLLAIAANAYDNLSGEQKDNGEVISRDFLLNNVFPDNVPKDVYSVRNVDIFGHLGVFDLTLDTYPDSFGITSLSLSNDDITHIMNRSLESNAPDEMDLKIPQHCGALESVKLTGNAADPEYSKFVVLIEKRNTSVLSTSEASDCVQQIYYVASVFLSITRQSVVKQSYNRQTWQLTRAPEA